jgi:hypothetical protein
MMLGMESRALHMLGKCSVTELHPPDFCIEDGQCQSKMEAESQALVNETKKEQHIRNKGVLQLD